MKLTDTQTIILSAAAGREDGSIHPLPKTLKGGGGRQGHRRAPA